MNRVLYTIGHSTHSLEYFVAMLIKHGVQAIGDVRSVPYSQRNPQFNRDALMQQLRAVNIEYVFLGKELGARSENPACYIDGKVQYNYLAEEPAFLRGLQRVRRGIERYRVALMCAERDPLTCHRTILVCRELRSTDLEISHILSDGTIETSAGAEKRLLSIVGIRPDMFHGEQECIEQAYEKQGHSIAYAVPARNPDLIQREMPGEDLHNRLHQ